ncbi:CRISPR-associated endoribonuclease Cas6 [Phormidium sp. LEGE 05292]|uniref:CRISPR-associated endoribonuclease Cas6 n=1 Tax=[Phormidium] sp. LEGE 05292 TaxID=767427 RepID=UPI001880F7FE|nr:CRISPR-associated endoribonuclease Cas6 [Phormidium sp. LEGE 05292]MBE9226180.1 CRISPR-associated endoribonuclease Cas6 [Phormidium sp. LEGE 05292]
MPHSLILTLIPQSPIPPGYLKGKHLHALFLNLVSSIDRTLGTHLHDQKTDKAFTLSPLQIGHPKTTDFILQKEHKFPIKAGTPCWWRIALLNDSLFGNLTKLWLNLNPEQPWHLGPANLQITSILGTPHSDFPWANYATYADIYAQASEEERQINLAFCTPTAFRQMQFDTALPTRDLVFNSLLRKWNQYSGIEFFSDLIEPIYPSFFDIHTEIIDDARSKFIGCVGVMNFRILGEVEPVKIKQINALADFALYSGIGRKTPMGMGMVRRFNHAK